MYATYWILILGVVTLFYSSSYLSIPGALAILVATGFFTVGVCAATIRSQRRPADQRRVRSRLSATRIGLFVATGTLANLLATVLVIRTHGLAVPELASLDGLALSANAISALRYETGGLGITAVPILLGIGYSAALLAPMIPTDGSKLLRVLTLGPIISALTYASLTTERLGFILSCAAYLGGAIASSIIQHGYIMRPTRTRLAHLGVASVLIGAAFVGVGLLRVGQLNATMASVVLDKQVVYAVGAVPAFSRWFDQQWVRNDQGNGIAELGFGTGSLAGMELLTGKDRHATRNYSEFVQIDAKGRSTNLYTAYRVLQSDFGFVGSLLMLTVFGFAFGRFYRLAQTGSKLAAVLFGWFCTVLAMSAWSPILSFTNVVAAIILSALVVRFARIPIAEGG